MPTHRDGRRRFLLATGAALAAGAASATADDATATPLHEAIAERARALGGASPRGLRLLVPHGCADNVRPVIDAFRALAGIAVEPLEVGETDVDVRLALDSLAGGADYDLALPPTYALPDLVASGAILPLTRLAARHEPAGFRDGILYGLGDRFDGELYGFQTDGDAYLMFYNRRCLESPEEAARYADRHGEALGVPRTWAELERHLAFFHRPEEGRYGGLLPRSPSYAVWEWWVRFHAKGVWPFSATLVPQIDSDAGVEALEDMLRTADYLAPNSSGLGLFGSWDRFGRGDVHCIPGWGGTQKYLGGPGGALRGQLMHGPMPGGEIGGEALPTPYFNWGWNYVVTAGSHAPEVAYLFALFAATPEISTRSVRGAGGFFDPFRAEHYADAEVRAIYGDDFLAVHEASLRGAIPDLYLANRGEYMHTLGEWLDRALDGRARPAEALANVARDWESISARSDRLRQTGRWLVLRARYPEAVRTRLRDLG